MSCIEAAMRVRLLLQCPDLDSSYCGLWLPYIKDMVTLQKRFWLLNHDHCIGYLIQNHHTVAVRGRVFNSQFNTVHDVLNMYESPCLTAGAIDDQGHLVGGLHDGLHDGSIQDGTVIAIS